MSIESTTATTTLFPSSFSDVLVSIPAPTVDSDPTIIYSLLHRPENATQTLVLLHGYPQNHTLWRHVAEKLPLTDWNVIIPDLPGCVPRRIDVQSILIRCGYRYGRSTKAPSKDGTHVANSKKSVARDIVALVDALVGPDCKFAIAGHDRGISAARETTASRN